MDNGTERYYYEWVNVSGPGIKYNIIDRTTHDVIDIATGWEEAKQKVKKLMESEREAQGIKTTDQIEIPSHYVGGRTRDKIEVEPVVVHR